MPSKSDESGASLRKGDPFFALAGDATWNAYIGKQGEEEYYIDGYMDAALELSGAILAKKLLGKVDTLVLPILYTARHGIELTLKFVIGELHSAGLLADERPRNHNIKAHHSTLSEIWLPDEQLRDLIAALKPFIDSLAAVDDDGQMLRYHKTQDEKRSLDDRTLVNIQVIDRSLRELRDILRPLRYRVEDLIRERKTGTHTKECSRADLFEIAKMLPSKDEQTQAKLDAVRARVKDRYTIGKEKFLAAVRMIERHREMGSLLGETFELIHVTDEHVMFAVEQWDKRFPKEASGGSSAVPSFSTWIEYLELAKNANTPIVKALTVDEIADLVALYNIGRESSPCEFYEDWVKRMRAVIVARKDVYASVSDLTGKTNFATALIKGLKIVGRHDLAERVQNRQRK